MSLSKTTREHAYETSKFMPDGIFPSVLDTLQMTWDVLHDESDTAHKGELIEKHRIVAAQSYRDLWLLAPIVVFLTIIVDNNIDTPIADNRSASTRAPSRMSYYSTEADQLASNPSLSPHYSTASGAQISDQPPAKDDWPPIKSNSTPENPDPFAEYPTPE